MDNIIQQRLNRIKEIFDIPGLSWVVRVQQVDTILQNGPQCGIVALGMALQNLGICFTIDQLMHKAREMNFTKSGEIFDASYLCLLGQLYTERCRVEKLETEQDELGLFNHLINKKLVLIAYDCDFNFEPAFKKGKKAHWAILSGIYAPVRVESEDSGEILDLSQLAANQMEKIIETVKTNYRDNIRLDSNRNYRQLVYCIGKQGKSSQYGVWSLSNLIMSNRQLSLIDDEKVNDDMFVKPSDRDLAKTLAFKYIVFD